MSDPSFVHQPPLHLLLQYRCWLLFGYPHTRCVIQAKLLEAMSRHKVEHAVVEVAQVQQRSNVELTTVQGKLTASELELQTVQTELAAAQQEIAHLQAWTEAAAIVDEALKVGRDMQGKPPGKVKEVARTDQIDGARSNGAELQGAVCGKSSNNGSAELQGAVWDKSQKALDELRVQKLKKKLEGNLVHRQKRVWGLVSGVSGVSVVFNLCE